jgi:CMP-2-keto-3-deoxyoctulosonic acid synthetase
MSVTKLESTEHIEQLRVLENGIMINAVEVKDDGISVDTVNDLAKVRKRYSDGLCN